MTTQYLLGNEAIARGCLESPVHFVTGYPGTPSSEVIDILRSLPERDYYIEWSVNEKVALENALAAAWCGLRALCTMKHVGLNVAADPLMTSAYTGVTGGLVIMSADDPFAHSSQNEQDSRYFAEFARVPCFEPSSQQEAYDMTREAFDASEKFGLPVLVRLVTRLAHSRAIVGTREGRGQNELKPGDWRDWTLLPVNARRRFGVLLDLQPQLVSYSNESAYNRLSLEGDRRLGIIAAGVAFNYLTEVLEEEKAVMPWLKVSAYPLPVLLVNRLIDAVDEVLVLEDGYPFIESRLGGLAGIAGKVIHGRLDGRLPASGELTPEIIRNALGFPARDSIKPASIALPGRPPQLCPGCPHADTFKALNEALKSFDSGNVFSDIGCYTLGALPPYRAVQTCVCMGASIGMSRGASDVGLWPSVAVIGESTFAHSGITPLLSAAAADADITVIILDNATVAMTGGQRSYGTGSRLLGIVEGVGVPKDHIRVIKPLPKNHEANVKIMREEIEHRGVSVIVADRECVEYPSSKGGRK